MKIITPFFLLIFLYTCTLEEIPDLQTPGTDDPVACFSAAIQQNPCPANCKVVFINCSTDAIGMVH